MRVTTTREQAPSEPPPAAEPTVAPPRRTRLLDWAAGAITVAVYVVVQLVFLQGPHPFDPSWYFRTASDFPDVEADLFTLRIGLLAPVRAAIFVFGPSEAALYAVPLLSGMALVAAVFAIMLLLFRDRVLAGAAALVTGLNVNYLVNSSQIFPDVTATATFTAAFLCLLLGGLRPDERSKRWLPTVAVVCGGVLLGWSYLIREFSPILLPAVIAVVLLLGYSLRRVALLAGAALATAALELVYGWAYAGDPVVHARLLLERGQGDAVEGGVRMAYIQDQLGSLFDTLLVFPRLLLAWDTGWVFILLAALALLALVLLRDRRLWLLAAWFLSFLVVMAIVGLGSFSSGHWVLNITNIRYWYPIFPPLVMGAFGGLWLLLRRRFDSPRGLRAAQLAAVALAAAVLLPGFREYSGCEDREAWRNDPATRWHELRSWFSTPEAAQKSVVWTDRFTSRLLPAYTASTFGREIWDGEIETLESLGDVPPAAGTMVLVHKDRWIAWEDGPEALEGLRDEWSPLFITGDQRMVVLGAAGNGGTAGGVWWELWTGFVAAAPGGTCGRNPYDLES
jgi:4-amino-4-deoxy-L-arabinose transferase-like glycosyltransferase